MKKVLGLDLGTNSIGWALVGQQINSSDKHSTEAIIDAGSRIIPMDMAAMGEFEAGTLKSQTSIRTGFRGVRRLYERSILRRERLHRVLNVMGFLPSHYAEQIDFERRLGQFLPTCEPKVAYRKNPETGKSEFLFMESFGEMLRDFAEHQPDMGQVPHGWTIYYLRKKALTQKIEKQELAWLLLNFNQKRGYYHQRGEDDDVDQVKEYDELTVLKVVDTGEVKKGETWYEIHLSDGEIYRRSSKIPLDWVGKTKEFIITHKVNKAGVESRSYSIPSKENDWTLIKKRTEKKIAETNTTIGCYIYDKLLSEPDTKINGALIQTIDRDGYRSELTAILEKQKEFHPELRNTTLYTKCVEELYRSNAPYRNAIAGRDFTYLFAGDIIFYHRPLKSKKSQIDDCQYEERWFKDPKTEEPKKQGVKCIHRAHPLFEEFRVWQLVQNLKIIELSGEDISDKYIGTEEERTELFEVLRDKKDLDKKSFLKIFKLKDSNATWNYGDITLPLAPVRAEILSRLKRAEITTDLSDGDMEALWHILYSVTDSKELVGALGSFAIKTRLNSAENFVEEFKKMKPFDSNYGSYSEKAIKKLLPLMRMGSHWSAEAIDPKTKERIETIVNGVADDSINERTRNNLKGLSDISQFRGLRLDKACYAVYDRHSEAKDTSRWSSPADIDKYLYEFKQHSLRNPIVEQLLGETLRTVRDVWTKHGEIDEIHVEMGREMRSPKKERERLTTQNRENETTNVRIRELLRELRSNNMDVRPESPADQQRLKLYEEGIVGSVDKLPEDIERIRKQRDPSHSEIIRYKCWLEQGYKSPYTGATIPLSELFGAKYQVEHIIPQARYFDDSLSNKVMCEAEINKDKGSMLAYEYICANENKKFIIGDKEVTLMSPEHYEEFVKNNFKNSLVKRKKLMLDEIPDSFIERQLNDTRYVSKVVRNILSHVVREQGEVDAVSTNVIGVSGGITAKLKEDWGVNDVWNNVVKDRFIRLNEKYVTNEYGEEIDNKFRVSVPDKHSRGFSKKRIDHRHHAMDAIVIACATRSHINYLNNESAKSGGRVREALRATLCGESRTNGRWVMSKPYKTFTEDVEKKLRDIVVSIKTNRRIMTKSTNRYQRFVDGEKVMVKQTKGDNRAIRKPLHKDTVFGLVNLQKRKTVGIYAALDNWQMITDRKLRSKIKSLVGEGLDKKQILAHFKAEEYSLEGRDISKVEVFYYTGDDPSNNVVAVRKSLDATFDTGKIDSITDSGIRKILHQHLDTYHGDSEAAFSADGLDVLNGVDYLRNLNGGKAHKPIIKVRISEKSSRFRLGSEGNKKHKYVEAAKGTNLFFAVYESEEGNRSYETIGLNIAIENMKQGLSVARQRDDKGAELQFVMSPNDSVYVPTPEQLASGNIDISDIRANKERIYKFVSCTRKEAYFTPCNIASPIAKDIELGSNNKSERAWGGEMIKEICIKIGIDRLGEISMV